MTALSDRLVAANTQGLSARAVARLARDAGYTLNHDTAARYLRGDHGMPDEATLIAFAEVLHVPLTELRQAARLPAEMTEPYRPPVESSRLTLRQRRAVDEIIRAMLVPRASDEPANVTDLSDRRRTKAPRAARHGTPEPPSD